MECCSFNKFFKKNNTLLSTPFTTCPIFYVIKHLSSFTKRRHFASLWECVTFVSVELESFSKCDPLINNAFWYFVDILLTDASTCTMHDVMKPGWEHNVHNMGIQVEEILYSYQVSNMAHQDLFTGKFLSWSNSIGVNNVYLTVHFMFLHVIFKLFTYIS